MSETRYTDFLASKFRFDPSWGFDLDPAELHPMLKPHQRDLAVWAIKRGRAAIFAAFGLGKSLIQIEVLSAVRRRERGRVLVIAPLGVRQEFMRDAAKIEDYNVDASRSPMRAFRACPETSGDLHFHPRFTMPHRLRPHHPRLRLQEPKKKMGKGHVILNSAEAPQHGGRLVLWRG